MTDKYEYKHSIIKIIGMIGLISLIPLSIIEIIFGSTILTSGGIMLGISAISGVLVMIGLLSE